MKKLYYFNGKKLKLIEVKNVKLKLLSSSLAIILVSVSLFWLSGQLFNIPFFGQTPGNILKENNILKSKVKEMTELYTILNSKIDTMIIQNNDLRMAANLPLIPEDELKLGTGGGSFDNRLDFLNSKEKSSLSKALGLLEDLEKKINYQDVLLKDITSRMTEDFENWQRTPIVLPVIGKYSAASYGPRNNPITGVGEFHKAIDITAPLGTPIVAAADGVVKRAGWNGGYGNEVTIDHGNGYETIYAHLSKVNVRVGEKIKRFDVVGLAGSTGLSTHPHLHYEVLFEGVNKNPVDYFLVNPNENLKKQ
ncbi:MAG: M23 family metallopeptidase [Ignavibacteriaceae bacterium]|nr:M23 family metallopeptidase [Ignavibacteriaceae bacterium]NUM71732.1 M23 family metallopeptidase [Ignavibacteriaceae bacterium]